MTSLYVVPTPVGNLGDMTLRAIDVLQQADYVLTEDTRTTGRLLKHFDITTKPISHHQHNEHKTLPGLIERLKGGQRLALVSDAGMPGISDPGFLLVRECIREGLEVECLPGATAF
ncbi:MAG: SAM-dependent methyltransferase, partial [Bacteroidota bacterium]